MGQNPLTTLLQESLKFGFICSLVSTGNDYCISSALPDPPIRRYGIVLYLFFNCTHSLISFPDLAGGRSRRRDLVKSDLYHVIACQECGRQVNSACPSNSKKMAIKELPTLNQMNNECLTNLVFPGMISSKVFY